MIVTPDRHIASLFKIRQTGVAGPSSAGGTLILDKRDAAHGS